MSQTVLISTPAPAPARLLPELPAQVHAQKAREVGILARDDRVRGAGGEGRDRAVLEEQGLVRDVEREPSLAGEAEPDLHGGPVGVRKARPDVVVRDGVAVEVRSQADLVPVVDVIRVSEAE